MCSTRTLILELSFKANFSARRKHLHIPLSNDPSSDLLVDDDTNSMLSDIKDSTSLAVVVFVGHTLLEGTIALNVHNISLLKDSQESGKGFNTMFPEFARKQVTSAATITLGVHHLDV